jgi:hypothetical protein
LGEISEPLFGRFRPIAFKLFNALLACALRDELGSSHQAVKTVMRRTGASQRTVNIGLQEQRGRTASILLRSRGNSEEILGAFLVAAERSPPLVTLKLVELRSTPLEALEVIDRQR